MSETNQEQQEHNESGFSDAAETTSNLINTADGVMRDALKAAGMGADDLAIIEKSAKVKNAIITGAELVVALFKNDGEAIAKGGTVLAAGALATAASVAAAAAFSVTIPALFLAGIGILTGAAVNAYWQEIKDLAKAADNKIDELQDWAATSLLNGLLALSAKLGAPDLLNSATGLNDQDPATELAAAKINVSPIVLDLDGDGIETLSKEQGIHFDLDNNGLAETVGWVSGEDGLLVRDINGNGTIDSGAELFDKNHPWFLPSGRTKCVQNRSRWFCGNYTQLANGGIARNGYQALADLDSNRDGIWKLETRNWRLAA